MLRKVKETLKRLFKKDKEGKREVPGESNKTDNKPKTIKRVELLQQELSQITAGYDKSLADLQGKYNTALWEYENAYSDLSEITRQYKLKMIPEADVHSEREKVKPFEEALNAVSDEISNVESYKKEDILKIIAEIEALKDEYLSEVAREVTVKYARIQELKTAYLQEVGNIGNMCDGILKTESTVQHHFNEAGYQYKPVMTSKFADMTAGVMLEGFAIPYETINDALANNNKTHNNPVQVG
ncbi:hypothetical protein H9655_02725 [Cytobacillus sp. Sa5YUA1]|uniref:Uncharacterized protein n=1 Tax=Cytobacillus stercorigallinarum TaxID=2762240 RepID=A0ABR8QK84_9BACI|nr:hypothetical protein [Cytobacillus stercorigallinarum]MBD7935931.1 hypothetical protein [Cytobacillus stercorigallinarum]